MITFIKLQPIEIISSSSGIVTPNLKSKSKKIIEEPWEVKEPIIINKAAINDVSTEAEESKYARSDEKKESKFKKRFMNRLPINSGKLEDAGEYQWIHKPTCEIDLTHSRQLLHQLQSWNENLKELLARLSKMQDGMKGEIQYWNEMAKILDAAGRECKSAFVETTLQVLQEAHPREATVFRKYREQVWEAMKEAKWNKKYLLSLKSVDTLYTGSWKEIAEVISSLMESIRSVYEKSNYYKEQRIVNFLDHMYQHLLNKMRKDFTIHRIMNWVSEFKSITESLDFWKIVNTKFDEGYFLRELMESVKPTKATFMKTMSWFNKDTSPMGASMHSTQTTFSKSKVNMKSEIAKFKQHISEWAKLPEVSPITRPMTAFRPMGNMGDSTGSAGFFGDDLTRPNSSWKKSRIIQPNKLLQSRQSDRRKNTFWFERAKKIQEEVTNTSQILENIDYMCNMIFKLQEEFIPAIKEMRKIEGQKLIKKIESFIKIYQLNPVDFDLFHYKAFSTFEWYVEGFEAKVKELEAEYNSLDEDEHQIQFINQENLNTEENKYDLEEDSEDEFDTSHDMVSMTWNVS